MKAHEAKPGGQGPARTLLRTGMRVGVGESKGLGLGTVPGSGHPTPPHQTQNHRAPRSWAGAQSHSACIPPRRGGRMLALRPQAHPMQPPGACQPTGTCLGPSRTLPASLSLSVPTTHLQRTEHKAPAGAPKLTVLASFLPSFIHSLTHSFNSGPDTKLA